MSSTSFCGFRQLVQKKRYFNEQEPNFLTVLPIALFSHAITSHSVQFNNTVSISSLHNDGNSSRYQDFGS